MTIVINLGSIIVGLLVLGILASVIAGCSADDSEIVSKQDRDDAS